MRGRSRGQPVRGELAMPVSRQRGGGGACRTCPQCALGPHGHSKRDAPRLGWGVQGGQESLPPPLPGGSHSAISFVVTLRCFFFLVQATERSEGQLRQLLVGGRRGTGSKGLGESQAARGERHLCLQGP